MAKNVIMMVGDGMGWEMSRAGAIQAEIEKEIAKIRSSNPDITNKEIAAEFEGRTLDDYYTEGKGFGNSYQNLENYTISTTGNTYIDGDKGNSALEGEPFNHNTGEAPIREGFEFNPEAAIVEGFNPESRDGSKAPTIGIFDPGFDEDPVIEGEAAIGAEAIASSSDRLFGVYGARGQGGNLPWRTANDDYSRAGIDAAGVNEETGFVELDEHCWFRHWLQRFEHHQ